MQLNDILDHLYLLNTFIMIVFWGYIALFSLDENGFNPNNVDKAPLWLKIIFGISFSIFVLYSIFMMVR